MINDLSLLFFTFIQNEAFTYSQLRSGTAKDLFHVNKSYMRGIKG